MSQLQTYQSNANGHSRSSSLQNEIASRGCCTLEENISRDEQKMSLWGGTALLAAGILKGRLSGLLLVGLGASLLYRGSTGHCHLYEAMGFDTSDRR